MCEGGKVEPVVTAADNSVLTDGDFNVSVTLSSELVEHFEQKLQKINNQAVKNHLVYAYLFKKTSAELEVRTVMHDSADLTNTCSVSLA